MPKQPLSRKRVASEDLDSDDGLRDAAPKHKKTKNTADLSLEPQKNDDGTPYWELSRSRRVQVSEFKGNTFVDVREFYESNGKQLATKKGVSLNIEQYNHLVQLLPQLETALKGKGFDVKRPDYGEPAAKPADETHGDDSDEPGQKASRKKKAQSKPNHEATSDEDDD